MGWCFCEDSDRDACYADRVQQDRRVVEVAKHVNSEGIDDAVGDEQSCIDADDSSWGRGICG